MPKVSMSVRRFRYFSHTSLAILALSISATVAMAGSVSYTYDALGRLSKAIYNNGTTTTTITYSYDAGGNRSSVVITSP